MIMRNSAIIFSWTPPPPPPPITGSYKSVMGGGGGGEEGTDHPCSEFGDMLVEYARSLSVGFCTCMHIAVRNGCSYFSHGYSQMLRC